MSRALAVVEVWREFQIRGADSPPGSPWCLGAWERLSVLQAPPLPLPPPARLTGCVYVDQADLDPAEKTPSVSSLEPGGLWEQGVGVGSWLEPGSLEHCGRSKLRLGFLHLAQPSRA